MTERISRLAQLEGLSIKDSKRMPHPSVLAKWTEQEFYQIDLELDVFRLTEKGRAEAARQINANLAA